MEMIPGDVSKILNIDPSSLIRTLKNKNKTYCGFIWKYKK
jgi:hypothetical protein